MQMAADILKFIREYNLNGMRRRREERSKLIGELLFNEPKQGATYQNSATEITEITEDVKCYRAKNGAVVWMTDSDLKRLNFEKVVPKPTLTKEEIDVKVQEFIHELKTNFTIKE